MQSGAITSSIDVAQLALYAFWIFFAGLILYLRGEDRREGYPLLSEPDGRPQGVLFGSIPSRKTFVLPHGEVRTAPHAEHAAGPLTGEPTGDLMVDGIGPASYVLRDDVPDRMYDSDEPKILPLRVATDFSIEPGDPDPRGMNVIGADGRVAGVVKDVWVDRPDTLIRYLEVLVADGRSVLFPMTLARFNPPRRQVIVGSVLAAQFAAAPVTRNPDRVTSREEDRITAYFASGYLYAEPKRQEAVL